MDLIKEALEFEKSKRPITSTNQRIIVFKRTKEIILGLNKVFKENKDPKIMDIMKRLTATKHSAEKRLK